MITCTKSVRLGINTEASQSNDPLFQASPGRMADTGMIRWPMNFPPSSNTAILIEASVGKTTCQGKKRNTLNCGTKTKLLSWLFFTVCIHFVEVRNVLGLTFLKTMASSSQTGLIALPCDVLVLNAFLLVSTGRPNMSISTYVPTFLSDRNWPEMIF